MDEVFPPFALVKPFDIGRSIDCMINISKNTVRRYGVNPLSDGVVFIFV